MSNEHSEPKRGRRRITPNTLRQARTFSLAGTICERMDAIMAQHKLSSRDRNAFADFLLDYALTKVESGELVLPIDYVPSLRQTDDSPSGE